MTKIAILGAGMAGFGAANLFSKNNMDVSIFEKNDYHGGNAASFEKNGFTFDAGARISITKNQRIRELFNPSASRQIITFHATVNNFWKGYWINHPPQVNLYGLPKEMVIKIIREFFRASKSKERDVNNYRDWLYKTFGKTFTENFYLDYTRKFHTTPAENLDIDWIDDKFYKPNLLEVVSGAHSGDGYNPHFIKNSHYPARGGFVRLLDPFLSKTKLNLSHEITSINPSKKEITFHGGKIEKYDFLLSSIPLPELIQRIEKVPEEVQKASKKLACTSRVSVNLGINRKNISKAHCTRFFDSDVIFSKLSFPHMFSSQNAPENCGSIQAEIYFSEKYKPLTKNPGDYIEPTISDLKRTGIITDSDKIIFQDARYSMYAHIIFDLERESNLTIVHKYLDDAGIHYCGRYGEWRNLWTDESFLSGEKAAKKVITQLTPGKRSKKIITKPKSIDSSN